MRGTSSASLLSRLISRERPLWLTLAISALLLLIPVGLSYLDGLWQEILARGYWRPLLLPSMVLIYIVVLSPILARSDADVLRRFRPLVLIDDGSFDRLVMTASRTGPIGEAVAFGVGIAVGFVVGQSWAADRSTVWLPIYFRLSMCLMFGLLAWTIYRSVAHTRLIAALHRQPLRIDLFDIQSFEPIGRQSLLLALAYVGGITLSMLFGLNLENIYAWQTWLIYVPLALVAVLVFFLNMYHTHRILAAEQKRELEAVREQIRLASRGIGEKIAAGEELGASAAGFSALIAYEARVLAAQTWPYNISMLRTLAFSVILPLVVRGITVALFGE